MRPLCEDVFVLKMTTKLSLCLLLGFFFPCIKKSSHVVNMPIARKKKHELLYAAGVICRLTVKRH